MWSVFKPGSKFFASFWAKCHGIIHSVSAAAGGVGAGLAQIPTSDTYIITPAQIGMIISLGKVFDMDITNSGAKSILTGIGASYDQLTFKPLRFL